MHSTKERYNVIDKFFKVKKTNFIPNLKMKLPGCFADY